VGKPRSLRTVVSSQVYLTSPIAYENGTEAGRPLSSVSTTYPHMESRPLSSLSNNVASPGPEDNGIRVPPWGYFVCATPPPTEQQRQMVMRSPPFVENANLVMQPVSNQVPSMPNMNAVVSIPRGNPMAKHEKNDTPTSRVDKDHSMKVSSANRANGMDSEGGSNRCVVGPSQQRKVFVGGVPKDMTQADLHTIFIRYGKVKKAWLQKSVHGEPQSHRGFGFVIFDDPTVVDKLLGPENFSTRLALGERVSATGTPVTIEVKRALTSNNLKNGQGPVHAPRQGGNPNQKMVHVGSRSVPH